MSFKDIEECVFNLYVTHPTLSFRLLKDYQFILNNLDYFHSFEEGKYISGPLTLSL